MKRVFTVILFSFFSLLMHIAQAAPIPVVASFSILGDVTRQIGGERIQVFTLIGADQDTHMYQLISKDLRLMRGAKLILLNGYGLEPTALQRAAGQSSAPLVYAVQGIRPQILTNDEHGHHHTYDPHVWNDPILMHIYARNITNALIKIDPAGKVYYQNRLVSYEKQLNELHNWAEKTFATIPIAKRKVLTGHDAFGYMAKRYQISFIAPQGVSTDAEPSARQVATIINQIRNQNIKAVFVENIKNPRMIQRISKETGVKIAGKLYSDALSNGSPATTYIDLFRYNVKALSAAMR
ncbi:MAG: zinc ABC transporter substrate-binding protein [Snodgrassella sp.]|nr:zinc ABC transporter substrate-binding protein [Snodgrassella sp.]